MLTVQKNQLDFLRRWVWANGWSEMLGLGLTSLIAWTVNHMLGNSQSTGAVLLIAVVFIITGTFCEGALVGFAQARVLRSQLPSLSFGRWIRLTALGAGLAWLAGMIPSTIVSLSSSNLTDTQNGSPPFSGVVVFAAAALMGIVLGPFLGIPQWFELRRHFEGAGWWIAANSAAWALGMVIVFAGATWPDENTSIGVIAPLIAITCLVAGFVVGAVHGTFLLWLIKLNKNVG